MGFLADLLAKLAVGVLQAWLARADLERATREADLIETLKLQNGALRWLAEARRDPERWAALRSLPGGAALAGGFTADPDPPSAASGWHL